jgi:tetratricopeptide (TPR) repeat protein
VVPFTPPQAQGMSPADLQRATEDMKKGDFGAKMSEAERYVAGEAQYKLSAAQSLKSEGNTLFKKGDYSGALAKYLRAKENAAAVPAGTAGGADALLAVRNNLAQCYLKMERWDDALCMCDEVLRTDHKSIKTLYRRGCALAAKGQHQDALSDLKRAAALAPAGDKDSREMIEGKVAEVQKAEAAAAAAGGARTSAPSSSTTSSSSAAVNEVAGNKEANEEKKEAAVEEEGRVEEVIEELGAPPEYVSEKKH